MISTVQDGIAGVFWWVLSASLDATVIIAVVAVVCCIARRWLAVKSVLLLWLVVWFNFFVPGFLPWTLGASEETVVAVAPLASPVSSVQAAPMESALDLGPVGNVVAATSNTMGQIPSVLDLLPWLWLLVALALAARALLAARH